MSRQNEWGETPESQIRAVSKYNAKKTTLFSMRLNVGTDADIIRWLWRQKSKAGSIKRLIRAEIEREKAAQQKD